MHSAVPTVPSEVAATWLDRWDRQQESFLSDREERFAVLCDVLEAALADVPEPVILDLGCGPGSLAVRLHRRLPGARVIGIDADPLLLGLAASAHPDTASWVDADLATRDWLARVPGRIHGAVSTTALHWLPVDALGQLYHVLGELLAPEGVFVNGDHMGVGDEAMNRLAGVVAQRSTERAGVLDHEGWRAWWDAALGEPALAELAAARRLRLADVAGDDASDPEQVTHHGNGLTVDDHTDLLLRAGFRAADRLWQVGNDQVVVGLR